MYNLSYPGIWTIPKTPISYSKTYREVEELLWNKGKYYKILRIRVVSFSWYALFHLSLSFLSHSSNWLGQVMWHEKYWWHHSALSTRPHSSTSLVTSVKVSWVRPRTPEVSFENFTWFWLTQLNSTINGFDPELLNMRYENYYWFD